MKNGTLPVHGYHKQGGNDQNEQLKEFSFLKKKNKIRGHWPKNAYQQTY